jgi:copper(I)-binding protein
MFDKDGSVRSARRVAEYMRLRNSDDSDRAVVQPRKQFDIVSAGPRVHWTVVDEDVKSMRCGNVASMHTLPWLHSPLDVAGGQQQKLQCSTSDR